MNEKELFENFCFLPDWSEVENKPEDNCEQKMQEIVEKQSHSHRKDLSTLLAELEEIKNNIEEIKAKEWHLAKLIKFHKEGFSLS